MDKLRDKMWFRLSVGGSSGGSGGSGADSPDDASPTALKNTLTVPNSGGSGSGSSEPSRFEKFRRASFRRKSTGHTSTRKRSKSPHFILQTDKSTSLEEADEDAESERAKATQDRLISGCKQFGNTDEIDKTTKSSLPLYKSEVDIVLNGPEGHIEPLLLVSDSKSKTDSKKLTLKSIKTDPPKRKFYKNFTSYTTQRKNSLESVELPRNTPLVLAPIPPLKEQNKKNKLSKKTILLAGEHANVEEETDCEDDDDEDDESDTDDDDEESTDDAANEDLHKRNAKKVSNGKEKKILLTDPKYKHNRIEKSSSKTKMSDLEKRESLKRSRSSKKIAAAAAAVAAAAATKTAKIQNEFNETTVPANVSTVTSTKKKDKRAEKEASKKQSRAPTNLNLQTLVKFVMNNKKFLSTEEFTLTRRKSISEAATSVITVAATCKPLPIALKYTPENVVAKAPNENDAKADRNVVLVKKQTLKNSFCDRLNNNNNSQECDAHKTEQTETTSINDKSKKKNKTKQTKKKSVEVEECREIYKCIASEDTEKALAAKVKRNSSNSSKSSGNFEDEAFYSCDELENEQRTRGSGNRSSGISVTGATRTSTSGSTTSAEDAGAQNIKRKSSSPSLTSRVAAKINEKTNNYRNRRAVAAAAAAAANKITKKQRKGQITGADSNTNVGGRRTEFYTQISVERLHTPSIVRQPSDRRPDATGNQALRSNGNTTDNTDDVLRLPNSAYPTAAGEAGVTAGQFSKGAMARSSRESNVPDGSNESGGNVADASAQDAAEGKDARRERLHQQHQQNKSAPVSVNRSESYKERLSQKRNRNSRRKTSDPSLTSRPNDEQADVGLSNSNYTASSNSSLSSGGGSESPSTSMEQMGGAGGATATAAIAHHHSVHGHHNAPHHMHQHSHQDSFHGSIGGGSMNASFWGSNFGGQPARHWNFESDDDDDLNETDWSSNVTAETLAALTDAEKKRQEIINEIYQTERSHVRILTLLERFFLSPLQESGVLLPEQLMLLFPPALMSLREIHSAFEQQLKQRRLEHNYVINHIGDLLANMFYGKSGDELCQFAAQFCERQQIALEALKERRRKDEQLQKILLKAESHKACRRLQLKDLLPAVLQRLTKYPLLFENLYKVTIRVVPEDTTEAEAIQRALESSKKILVDVNQAVKTAEDSHKLQNIQRKLDKSTFDKDEFKCLDLTQYRLIHDGSLTMKKNPSIQLHGLLFENMIVLLTKQDDKYSMKYLHATRNAEVNNKPVSPIMSIDSETLVRQEAADKNSFFLIKTKTSQMLELRAPSSSECKTWFKHISDAAEQYKPRSKNANHEPVDDPAIATIPHSNTKESLELTPERPPPQSATATITTTPLAPMMPIATASSVLQHNVNNNNNGDNSGQLRNGRRESTPTAGADLKQRLGQNELTPAMSPLSSSTSSLVNRTMSTRSCGEANNNNSYGSDAASGVTLRHTQSARQANGPNATGHSPDDYYNIVGGSVAGSGGGSKRDSASIVYSNNSNNTRTLMQSSPQLVEPTAIQISISPAHTAKPVLTPSERLRRLDVAIRDGLLEKQKIICDMFRLPVEHFHEIVDIAAMPEAPKDSADIALAAYAQVQSLTEVVNEYMHVTPEQEISAVSTAVCDQCHEKQQQQQQHRAQRPLTPLTAASSNSSSSTAMNSSSGSSSTTTQIAMAAASDTPPPLPPPNKQSAQQQTSASAAKATATATATVMATSARTVLQNALLDDANMADIHEDDDGYCEIDELRLPALPAALSAAAMAKASSPPPPLPPPAGSFKTAPPPPPPPPPATAITTATAATSQLPQSNSDNHNASNSNNATTVPELVKRQSTISADSIPEESADEVTQALGEDAPIETSQPTPNTDKTQNVAAVEAMSSEKEPTEIEDSEDSVGNATANEETEKSDETQPTETDKLTEDSVDEIATTPPAADAEPQTLNDAADKIDNIEQSTSTDADERMEVNEAYETLSTLSNKLSTALSMVDNATQTLPLPAAIVNTANASTSTTSTPIPNAKATAATLNANGNIVQCGPNRIQHANSLEPSVPCYALNSIVSALNAQISLLLPKINERDMERERLRKENQHLRELLNAMHERQRVEEKLVTPIDGNVVIGVDATAETDEIDGDNSSNTNTNTNSNSLPTVAAATATTVTPTMLSDTTDANATITDSSSTTATEALPAAAATASLVTEN